MAAAVQVLPVIAAVNPALLQPLYGVTPSDKTTVLLLRHRAVLLGLVGVALFAGAAVERWRAPALVLALASKLSYVILWATSTSATQETSKVGRIDVLTASALLVASALLWGMPLLGRGRPG
ncbi:hypothetical protein P2318_20040 [Myxococcaceae bacterium GXIMD 01537]